MGFVVLPPFSLRSRLRFKGMYDLDWYEPRHFFITASSSPLCMYVYMRLSFGLFSAGPTVTIIAPVLTETVLSTPM